MDGGVDGWINGYGWVDEYMAEWMEWSDGRADRKMKTEMYNLWTMK